MVSQRHLVLAPLAGWGHVRAEVNLALSLLEQDPDLIVTFLPDRRCTRRILQELSTHPSAVKTIGSRLRVQRVQDESIEGDRNDDQDAIEKEYIEGWDAALDQLLSSSDVPKPGAIAIDLMRVRFLLAKTRARLATQDNKTKVMAMIPALGAYFTAVKHSVDSQNDAELDRFDSLVRFPGLSPTFAYETLPIGPIGKNMKAMSAPTKASVPLTPRSDEDLQEETSGTNKYHASFPQSIYPTDGLLTMICPEIEPEIFRAIQDFFQSSAPESEGKGVPVFGLGFWQQDKEVGGEIPTKVNNAIFPTDDGRVARFLDSAREHKGEQSVVYVSLGTFAWPAANPELLHWLLQGLLEAGFSVVITLATSNPVMLDQTAELLKDDRIVVVSWAPQSAVLAHPATAFIVSHVGASGSVESITAEIPVVAVPFAIDQPSNAAILERLGMCVRLWQLSPGFHGRTLANGVKVDFSEESVKDEMRRVFADLKAGKGGEMRANARRAHQTAQRSVQSGQALQQREMFLASL